jgi:hypothetical protein
MPTRLDTATPALLCLRCGAPAQGVPGLPGLVCRSCGTSSFWSDPEQDLLARATQRCERLLQSPGASWRYAGLEGLSGQLEGAERPLNVCPASQYQPSKEDGILLLTDRNLFFVNDKGASESIQKISVREIRALKRRDRRRRLCPVSHLEVVLGEETHVYMTGRVAALEMESVVSSLLARQPR